MYKNVIMKIPGSITIYDFSNRLINSVLANVTDDQIKVNYQLDDNGEEITTGSSIGWWFEFVVMNIYKIKFEVSSVSNFKIWTSDIDGISYSDKTKYNSFSIGTSTKTIQYLLITNTNDRNNDNNSEFILLNFAASTSSICTANIMQQGCLAIKVNNKDENISDIFYSNRFYISLNTITLKSILNNGLIRASDKYIFSIDTLFPISSSEKIIYCDAILNDGNNIYDQIKYDILSTSNLEVGSHYEINNNKYYALTANLLLKY